MVKTSNHYILILCGGSGPRLWPLSRASRPKQFLTLFSQKSLIRETFERFQKIVPTSHIYFITHQKFLDSLKKEFGNLVSEANFIGEPEKKNTATAILYGSMVIASHHPDSVITAAPSDHYVQLLPKFKKNLLQCATVATTFNQIVTIGVHPTYPNPGFGYIITESLKHGYHPVNKFYEKPSVVDAQLLIKKDAVWNSGIYTYTYQTLVSELKLHQKNYTPVISSLESGKIKSAYDISPTLSIDKAISEKSSQLANITAKFTWSDIGEWQAIWQHLKTRDKSVVSLTKDNPLISINSKNCLVHGTTDKLIGLVGLNNLAIIDTPDGLLVCNLHDTFAVRDLVKKIATTPALKKYFLTKNDR